MGTYDQLAKDAQGAIAAAGSPVTLRKPGRGATDPSTGLRTTTPADYPLVGVRKRTRKGQQGQEPNQQPSGGVTTAYTFLLAGTTVPESGDTIIRGSERYTIVNVHELSPAGTAVLWEVEVST